MFKRTSLFLFITLASSFIIGANKIDKEFGARSQNKINKIILTRNNTNKFLTDEAILNSIPYKEDTVFDLTKTSIAIHNLYKINSPYSFFEQVYILQENLPDDKINLHLFTYEKPQLEQIVILGNKAISDEDLESKLELTDIQAINEVDIEHIIKLIKKAYLEKNFHTVEVKYEIFRKENKASVVLTIQEGEKSFVKKVIFKGNKYVKSKTLRENILTREDWILAFLNKAGIYDPNNIDIDKYLIENFYKTQGFFMAKVTDVKVDKDPTTQQYTVTYTVSEGDCYTISDVKFDGCGILIEDAVLKDLPLKKGNVYSQRDFADSLEKIRKIWGAYGYIFADIDPLIVPDPVTKTISVTLNSEFGNKVFVNRINIVGNNKTQDKVIRRRLTMFEGDMITSTGLDVSKARVENLGYFEPMEGVNWKINRIDESSADLDLMLKEAKTGRFNMQFGFGGSEFNPLSVAKSLKIGGAIADINFLGSGIMVRGSANWSREEWSAAVNLANPWFLEKPILAEMDLHYTQAEYGEELQNVESFDEKIAGGFIGFGKTLTYSFLQESVASTRIGAEYINHTNKPKVNSNETGRGTLQLIMNKSFQDGTFFYLSGGLAQDFRNNSLHPSFGYQWAMNWKLGVSDDDCTCDKDGFGFGKIEADASWYTPLVQNYLILGLHAHAGIVGAFKEKTIPYRELYHVGGPTSVRGFLYGQIGPTFLGDSIGATKGFWVNAEIIFPITPDFSMKGTVFYDGGSGWDTPYSSVIPDNQYKLLLNNGFEFRHAVGFGFRMIYPQPLRIDVGFKLDKKKNEKAVEVHFSSNREF